jgi:acetylornithine deacetylase
MNVFELTRKLIDIESITPNEKAVGDFVFDYLQPIVSQYGGNIEKIEVEPNRNNIFAWWGDAPAVTLSTHLDTVPPFFASKEDDEFIWGRGACDVKDIIASMICAAQQLLAEGVRNFGVLFVVGEERNSAGAYHAGKHPRGSKYIINGEPTSNKLALGSKGALRYEVIASGRMAHSAYPELGDSAILKLLDVLQKIRSIELPVHEKLGPSTLNIGTIAGGRAPNVIPDYAKAELFFRLVDDGNATAAAMQALASPGVEIKEVLRIPAVRLGSLPGFDTCVVAYTTDIPAFGTAWGQPFLLGPGTIHVAHTSEERISKKELFESISLYAGLVRTLLRS